MTARRFLLTTALLMVSFASGCNGIRNAWSNRGLPPQYEPELTDTAEKL